MSNGKYLYAFRDPKMAYEQEVAYVQQAQKKKDGFDGEKYTAKKSSFGLIVFKSKKKLSPLTVYLAYSQRWMIEKYSYKQIFRMLSKYKKVRTEEGGQWEDVIKLKYIEELAATLGV